MKQFVSILLALCLIVGVAPLAYAEGGGDNATGEIVEADDRESPESEESPIPEISETHSEGQKPSDTQEEALVKVSSLEELEAAVSNAKDGDIIEISKQVSIAGDTIIETEKHITLKRSEDFYSYAYFNYAMFDVWAGGILKGFEILDTAEYKQTIDLSGPSKIIDCQFDGNNAHRKEFINVTSKTNLEGKPTISNCTFTNNVSYSVNLGYGVTAICESCAFINNSLAGIYNCGDLELVDCTISGNWGGGIVGYSNTTTMTNCRVYGNTPIDLKNPDGTDIYINGTFIITDEAKDEAGFYDELTGEKIALPYNNNGIIRLTYFSTAEDAEAYFAVVFAPDSEEETQPIEDNGQEPPEGENEDQEPPAVETGTTGDDVGTPQEPPTNFSQENNSGGNDTQWWLPTFSTPSTSAVPEDEDTETTVDDVPIEDTFRLVCGSAVIDISKTIVLIGCGDGIINGDDPVTRAQLASIIYYLLTDESIAIYKSGECAFADVAQSSWYAPYVQTIGNAGIVYGVGAGQYAPDGLVTWAQTITVFSHFVEVQSYKLQNISYNGWARNAIETAVAHGWIEDRADFDPDAVMGRVELMQFINSVLELYRV